MLIYIVILSTLEAMTLQNLPISFVPILTLPTILLRFKSQHLRIFQTNPLLFKITAIYTVNLSCIHILTDQCT